MAKPKDIPTIPMPEVSKPVPPSKIENVKKVDKIASILHITSITKTRDNRIFRIKVANLFSFKLYLNSIRTCLQYLGCDNFKYHKCEGNILLGSISKTSRTGKL